MIKIIFNNVEDDLELGQWAKANCPSFNGWTLTEKLAEDLYTVYTYYFDIDQDAVLFQLRWQGLDESL